MLAQGTLWGCIRIAWAEGMSKRGGAYEQQEAFAPNLMVIQ